MNDDTRFLDRPGGRLAYDDAGTGPLVVAAPGLGDLRRQYRFLRRDLLSAGHRVVTVDLRGHGESSTGWTDFSKSAVADDLIALVEHLDAGPATLVGNSYAGGAAVVAAARRPDLVNGLVLLGAFVRDAEPGLKDRAMIWLVRRSFGHRFWASYYRSLHPGTPPADLDEHVALVTANLAEPGRWAAVSAMLGASNAATDPLIAEVRAPALVVMGGADPDFDDPAGEARRTADELGGEATVVMVDGAGHYPHVQQPATVSPAVVDFLDQLCHAPA